MCISTTTAENDSRQRRQPVLDDCLEPPVASMSALKARPAERAPCCAGRRRATLIVAFVLWGAGVAAGSWYSFQYEMTAAATVPAQDQWPTNELCALSSRCPTLVMFAHPRCPCTRASLHELELLMTHCRGRVDAHVIFFQPRSTDANWAKTDLWDRAARIPGVTASLDRDGTVQEQFTARVSGEVFLYLPTGELAFHGGITASRGHAGDNDGRCALESLVLNQRSHLTTTPVYGCTLIPANLASQKCDGANDTRSDQ
jgi:hypothetical protein